MSRTLCLLMLWVACGAGGGCVWAQVSPPGATSGPDYSKEAFVTELDSTTVTFENDGTARRQSSARIRIQSDAGVQRFGVLTFSYQSATETLEVEYVRVRKPDGSVVDTSADTIQDMAADVTRAAPFYSDLREKHVAVKGLASGDVLEYQAHWESTKPLAPGQFWFAYNFSNDAITLQEQLRISVPRDRPVKWKSAGRKPEIREEGPRRIFIWTSSQLKHRPSEQEKADQDMRQYQAARGQLPPPDVLLSSFQDWAEVGRWYGTLQQERVQPTPGIRSKAAEITRTAASEEEKLRAIYGYVSTSVHYIGIALGIGRYQAHAAGEVLDNQYGDCKDKHTLLAALLDAAGIRAYPALVNSTHAIDPDVPSPGQFDHVISAIPGASGFVWLDTTTEVAPFAYLLTPLRGKPALVIFGDKSPALVDTSADPSSKAEQTFQIDAKLDDTGTLEGKVERTDQGGDLEVVLRTAFRRVPLPQWKDLVQQISYLSGFGGDVSEVTASPPEKTDEPFHMAYTYKRKDFPDWSERRVRCALPSISLPALPEEDREPSHPIWLGAPMEARLKSRVALPKGYSPKLPAKLDLDEDFAEYHASYAYKDGVLTTVRSFRVKLREVPASEYQAYKKFRKALEDEDSRYVDLSSGSSARSDSYQEEIWRLPYSQDPEAARAYDDARAAFDRGDFQAEIAALDHAVRIDPRFARAWLWLGEIHKSLRQGDSALEAYDKAIEADPQQPVSYKALGSTLLSMGDFEEALETWRKLAALAPGDGAGLEGMGAALSGLKRYDEAAAALESAAKLDPGRGSLQQRLGSAYLHGGHPDKALAAYQKALQLDDRPDMFNTIAYELAEARTNLPMALEYAQKAVAGQEEASQRVNLSDLRLEDFKNTADLAAYWDTLGWIHFRMGNLAPAERYLDAAWRLSQWGLVAEHLGQVYERQGKKAAAIHAYRLALAASTGPEPDEETAEEVRGRLKQLEVDVPKSLFGTYPGGDELSRMRTIKLPRLATKAVAEVLLLVGTGSKILEVKITSDSENVKGATRALTAAPINQPFPDDVPTRVVLRGTVGCYPASGCSLVWLPPNLGLVE